MEEKSLRAHTHATKVAHFFYTRISLSYFFCIERLFFQKNRFLHLKTASFYVIILNLSLPLWQIDDNVSSRTNANHTFAHSLCSRCACPGREHHDIQFPETADLVTCYGTRRLAGGSARRRRIAAAAEPGSNVEHHEPEHQPRIPLVYARQ